MSATQPGSLFSGTSGLSVLAAKRDFPVDFQEKSRLTYYASIFNSIEVNSSFYKVPQVVTMRKWAESVPDNFRFTFKLWKEITHNKGLAFKPEDVHRFMDAISIVGNKQGSLLIQFPPSLSVESSLQLEALLVAVQQSNVAHAWKPAVEFRHRSWYCDDIYELLSHYQAAMVLHDLPASAAPLIETSDFIYLRFHGPGGGYRGTYPDDFLYEYAGYIQDWKNDGKDVYVYFNNTMGDALRNLITLNRYVTDNDAENAG